MSDFDKMNCVLGPLKENATRFVRALRNFFKVEDDFDESGRRFFKLSAGAAVATAMSEFAGLLRAELLQRELSFKNLQAVYLTS